VIPQNVRARRPKAAACLLPLLLLFSSFAKSAEQVEPFDPKRVEIHVQHGIELPWKKPGFRIEIAGWLPDSSVSVHAVGPSGEKIEMTPADNPLQADGEGLMTMDVDYERKGLRPGHWIFLVAGKAGIHMVPTDLPLVERPTAANPKWRLTFGEPNGKQH
jgi:hypothetical protein